VPFRVRHRGLAVLLTIVLAAIGAGAIAWVVATRTHSGTGDQQQTRHLRQVSLCQNCAHDYNPDATSGPKHQNPGSVGLAIDGDPSTGWSTETYYTGRLGKAGVGLYVDAAPGVRARELDIATTTPGFSAHIYARTSAPTPDRFDAGAAGWADLAGVESVHRSEKIPINSAGRRYRYYLVWITRLPPGRNLVTLNEITLYH
jgi:serine/threonine-protein kinase